MTNRILVVLGDQAHTTTVTWHAIQLAHVHSATLTAVAILDVTRLRRVGPHRVGSGEAARQLRRHRMKQPGDIIEETFSNFETACNAASIQNIEFAVKKESLSTA